ncbi:MAG: hypothetical protein OEU36_25200 [Gammaproteobacteria bacterium]|nr:hypothetical protein [Gammaproteobacteria bacterium]
MSRRWNHRTENYEENDFIYGPDPYVQALMDALYKESMELARQNALRLAKDWKDSGWLQAQVDENIVSQQQRSKLSRNGF